MNEMYTDLIGLIERLHRGCLDVIKVELDRQEVRNLSAVQAMILFNLGNRELAMGQLIERGRYPGPNLSYSIKMMVESGYVVQTRSYDDKRSLHVRSSELGRQVCVLIESLFGAQSAQLAKNLGMEQELIQSRDSLHKLDSFLSSSRLVAPAR